MYYQKPDQWRALGIEFSDSKGFLMVYLRLWFWMFCFGPFNCRLSFWKDGPWFQKSVWH